MRVGITGMGIGRQNARGLHVDPRSEIRALCDLDESRMRAFAGELHSDVKLYTDFSKMCRDPEIDAIFIGTPNQLHVPMALEAIRHDKHVLVTKPLADSLPAARELVQAAEASGVVNMMSLSTRFGPACRQLGDLAREKYFGDLYYARARSIRRSGIPDWNAGFIQTGGGAFRDMGVHVLDAAWWLLGQPQPISVTGVAGARFGPRGLGYWDFRRVDPTFSSRFAADDYAGGFIRFEDGSGLQVESFWASHQPNEVQIELFGEEAGARLSPLTLYRTIGGAPADTQVTLPKGPSAWENIAAHFVECILDGIPCQAPLRHGMIIQEMMESLLLSAETGKEVRIGD